MNLSLKRLKFNLYGIFGELRDESESLVAVTLEHSFPGNVPALPTGSYVCRRGPHRLESMSHDFETFEIEKVPGHTRILFHAGNYNKDSKGCILLGTELAVGCILESRPAFARFMALQSGLETFLLAVA